MRSKRAAIRVAVVDDDVSIREALTALLSACGYDAVAFASAAEFTSIDVYDGFTCLLIDMYMPEMTGLQVLQRMKSAGVASKAILMSSEGGLRLHAEASRLGAHAFIEKSLGFEKLIEAVEHVVRSAVTG